MPSSAMKVARRSAKKAVTREAKKVMARPPKNEFMLPATKAARNSKTPAARKGRTPAAPNSSSLRKKRDVFAHSSLGKTDVRKGMASLGRPDNGAVKRSSVAMQGCASQPSKRKKNCSSIISALHGAGELSPKVRQVLGGLVSIALADSDGTLEPYREAAITMVREALLSVEQRLKRDFGEAQAKVEQMYAEVEEQHSDAIGAEAQLRELQKVVAASKSDLKESINAIHTSQYGLETVTAFQKASQCKLEAAALTVERLRRLDQDVYQPLKLSGAHGAHGRKQLLQISKVGKNIGFKTTLLETIPEVLKKEFAKRRTVDGFMIDDMDSEFFKHYSEQETILNGEQAAFLENTATVQDARQLLKDTLQARSDSTRALAEAQAACRKTAEFLTKAHQQTRKFRSSIEKSVQELSLAEARLNGFQAGPFAAFKAIELQPDMPRSVHASCHAAEVGDPAAVHFTSTVKSTITTTEVGVPAAHSAIVRAATEFLAAEVGVPAATECLAPMHFTTSVLGVSCPSPEQLAISESIAECRTSEQLANTGLGAECCTSIQSTDVKPALDFCASPQQTIVEPDAEGTSATLAADGRSVAYNAVNRGAGSPIGAQMSSATLAGDDDATLAWAPTEVMFE